MKRLKFNQEEEQISLWAQRVKNQIWLHHKGKTFIYEEVSSKRKTKSVEGGSDQIKAPMPGKILKINFKVGDAVNKNESLVIMEAMKMEYNLKAEVSGQIKNILCKEGEQVSLGQLLVTIEEEA